MLSLKSNLQLDCLANCPLGGGQRVCVTPHRHNQWGHVPLSGDISPTASIKLSFRKYLLQMLLCFKNFHMITILIFPVIRG